MDYGLAEFIGGGGVNVWNLLTLIIIVVGFLIQNAKFKEHMQVFEAATNNEIVKIKSSIIGLRQEVNKANIDIAKIQVALDHVDKLVSLSLKKSDGKGAKHE